MERGRSSSFSVSFKRRDSPPFTGTIHKCEIFVFASKAGADPARFPEYSTDRGRAELDGICNAAEASGVFGVPTFVLAGEIFWGREHLPEIREMLGAAA